MVFLKFKSLTRFSRLNTGWVLLSCFKGPALLSLLPQPQLLRPVAGGSHPARHTLEERAYRMDMHTHIQTTLLTLQPTYVLLSVLHAVSLSIFTRTAADVLSNFETLLSLRFMSLVLFKYALE